MSTQDYMATIEWYNKFSPQIVHTIHSLYMYNVNNQTMHGTAKESIISLMEKIDKNRLMIANWRPLSLLNCDYKIYAKVLANRLQYVMAYLISQDQNGFLKNRYMLDNVLDLNLVIEHCQRNNIPGLITIVDFAKAFDTVEWSAMQAILRKFGFDQTFIDMLMICFKDFKTRILNNGHFTDYIRISRGNKQGCPISSLIFHLVVEVVGLKLKQNENIKGISIGGSTKVASQFADDLWTVMKQDRNSFDTQMRIFKEFERFTSLAVNYDKTELLRISSQKTDAQFYSTLPLKWSDGPVRVLGIYVCNDIAKTIEINYNIVMDKFKQVIQTWSSRSLTMLGRIQVVNSLCVLQFIFRALCLPTPSGKFFEEYRKIVSHFIWQGRKPKMSFDRLTLEKGRAGFNLCDIKLKDTSVKCNLLLRILSKDATNFTKKAMLSFIDIPDNLIMKVCLNKTDIKKITHNSLLNDLMCALAAFKKVNPPQNKSEVSNTCPWFNSFIKKGNNMIYLPKLNNHSIKSLKDFCHPDKDTWLSYEEFIMLHGLHNNIVNFLDYYTIVKNIPKYWIHLLKLDNDPTLKNPIQELEKAPKKSAFVYKQMIVEKQLEQKARYRWENILHCEIDDNAWYKHCTYVYKCTNCTKLRWFQFRQINHIITTNYDRYKWNLINSPACTFCHTEDETVVHLFCKCVVVRKNIWKPMTNINSQAVYLQYQMSE